jgi:ribosome maturation factor RimP
MDLHTLLEETLSGLGYALADLELPGRSGLLRVFIDKPEAGGVTIDDCELVSRHLVRLLEVENVDYERLEVSSPGLDRPLKKLADFERFAGEPVRVRLCAPVGGQRNFQGKLLGVVEGRVRLCLAADAAGRGEDVENEMELDFNAIEKARLAPEFGQKPAKRRGRG